MDDPSMLSESASGKLVAPVGAKSVASTSVSEPIRFSLRTLMIGITGFCVLMVPYRWFGAFYLVLIVFSIVLIASCSWAYRKERFGFLYLFTMSGLFISLLMLHYVPLLLSLLVFLVCVVGCCIPLRPRAMLFALCAVSLIPLGMFFSHGFTAIIKFDRLRTMYPIASIGNRLDFEKQHTGKGESAGVGEGKSEETLLSPLVESNLATQEDFGNLYPEARRMWSLASLHSEAQRQFAIIDGFGFSRMRRINLDDIEIKPRQAVTLPLPLDVSYRIDRGSEIHSTVIRDFVSPERIGFVKNQDYIVGFEPHGFSDLPKRLISGESDGFWSPMNSPAPTVHAVPASATSDWSLTRLELVSLLRHDEPAVYIAETLPQMDQLGQVPHRSLNEFEKSALPRLTAEEDLVVKRDTERIRMLGSVRASKDCLQCHSGERGRLLGAFSYELSKTSSDE